MLIKSNSLKSTIDFFGRSTCIAVTSLYSATFMFSLHDFTQDMMTCGINVMNVMEDEYSCSY